MIYDLEWNFPEIDRKRIISASLVLANNTNDEQCHEIMADLDFKPVQNSNSQSEINTKMHKVLEFSDYEIDFKQHHFYVGKIANAHHMRAKLLLASRHDGSIVRLTQLQDVKKCRTLNSAYNLLVRYDKLMDAASVLEELTRNCDYVSNTINDIARQIKEERTVERLTSVLDMEIDNVSDTLAYYLDMMDLRKDRDDVQKTYAGYNDM